MHVEELITRFKNVKSTGGRQYICLCPAHKDQKPSLTITERENKILLHCFAGCNIKNILSSVGLNEKDLFNNTPKRNNSTVEYFYTDENKKNLYKVIRYEPKRFVQAKYNSGKWEYNMKGVRYVPYNLPQVIEADTVYIVEGEKDVESLKSIGLVATTTVGGAESFRKRKNEYIKFFQNKTIYIIPDNDEAGKKYANQIYQALEGIAKSIKILNLTDELQELKRKGDITDVLIEYGKNTTLEILKKLKTNNYKNSDNRFPINNADDLNEANFEKILSYLNINIKYNIVTKRVEITGMPEKYSKSDLYTILPIYIKDILRNNEIKINNIRQIEEFLTLEISKNNYNPIVEMLNNYSWDGNDRIESICQIFGIEKKLDKTLFVKWLLQTVAIQFNTLDKPFGAEGILVLQGKQGIGKSYGLSLLCPNPEWFADGVVIDMNNKDSQIKATSRWFVELRRDRLNVKKRTKCTKSIFNQSRR